MHCVKGTDQAGTGEGGSLPGLGVLGKEPPSNEMGAADSCTEEHYLDRYYSGAVLSIGI